MDLGEYEKVVLTYLGRNSYWRKFLYFVVVVGLIFPTLTNLRSTYDYLKEKITYIAGIQPTDDEVKNERYLFLSGYYLRAVQDNLHYSSINSDPAQILIAQENRLASLFEGSGLKYSSIEFMGDGLTLAHRYNALSALRSRVEVYADRLGSRYRGIFDFGYYLGAALDKISDSPVGRPSPELLALAIEAYERAQEGALFRYPDLVMSQNSCSTNVSTNSCITAIVESSHLVKEFLRVRD